MPSWGESKKRETLVRAFTRYKQRDPSVNPAGPDGKPLTLRGVTLRIASDGTGREIMTWTVTSETDPVQLVAEVLERADQHAEDYQVGGTSATYAIEPLFGDGKSAMQRHGEHTYQPSNAQSGADPTRGFGGIDLRRRENQESAALQTMGALAVRSHELMVQGYGGILVAMERLCQRVDERAERAEQRVDRMRADWEAAQDQAAERQLKIANGMALAKVKGAMADVAVNMLPSAMRGVQGKLAAWAGVEDVPIDERIGRIVEKVFASPEATAKVMEALDDSERQALLYLIQEVKAKKDAAVSDAKIRAIASGVSRPMPLAQFRALAAASGTKKELKGA